VRSPYLNHFETFISAKLPSSHSTFTKEDIVAWVQSRDVRRNGPGHVRNIVEHLLKRVTNYSLRDDNDPPSRVHDDLFYMLESNLFRRYQPGVDPAPFHMAVTGEVSRERREQFRAERLRRTAREGRYEYEEELQQYLNEDPGRLESGLKLYTGGLEYWTPVGLIDLLCTDSASNLVILELKVAGTSDQVSGQLQRYMGWVTSNMASAVQRVRGIVVAHNISDRLFWATRRDSDVELFEYKLEMSGASPVVKFTKVERARSER
jgi:hypothetical protein